MMPVGIRFARKFNKLCPKSSYNRFYCSSFHSNLQQLKIMITISFSRFLFSFIVCSVVFDIDHINTALFSSLRFNQENPGYMY